MWSTQALQMLSTLQEARGLQPLHIYMNGDSTFRQQKNFLCSFLQPGFTKGGWALDNTFLHEQRESSCYHPALRLRVTYIDNSCCDTRRLAYLATHPDTDPYGNPDPPVWRPSGKGSGGSSSTSGNGADGSSSSSGGGSKNGSDRVTLVMYMNCGLHLLHLGAARPFECLPQQALYGTVLQNFSRAAEELYPGAPQVFMTSNNICEGLFTEPYAAVVRAIRTNRTAVIAECVAASLGNTRVAVPQLAGNAAAIAAACREGLFTGESTRRLRQRMIAALAALRPLAAAAEEEAEEQEQGAGELQAQEEEEDAEEGAGEEEQPEQLPQQRRPGEEQEAQPIAGQELKARAAAATHRGGGGGGAGEDLDSYYYEDLLSASTAVGGGDNDYEEAFLKRQQHEREQRARNGVGSSSSGDDGSGSGSGKHQLHKHHHGGHRGQGQGQAGVNPVTARHHSSSRQPQQKPQQHRKGLRHQYTELPASSSSSSSSSSAAAAAASASASHGHTTNTAIQQTPQTHSLQPQPSPEGNTQSTSQPRLPPPSIDLVDGWALTAGQCWASQTSDGRHFPYLVPLQVMELLQVLYRRLLPPPLPAAEAGA